MTIRALEVSAASFDLRWDIPTTTSLVGDQRKIVVVSDFTDKGGVGFNRLKSVCDGEG